MFALSCQPTGTDIYYVFPPPPPRRIVHSLGAISDCESSDSEPEAMYKLLSDDKADGDFLSDIDDESTYRVRITGQQEIKE